MTVIPLLVKGIFVLGDTPVKPEYDKKILQIKLKDVFIYAIYFLSTKRHFIRSFIVSTCVAPASDSGTINF